LFHFHTWMHSTSSIFTLFHLSLFPPLSQNYKLSQVWPGHASSPHSHSVNDCVSIPRCLFYPLWRRIPPLHFFQDSHYVSVSEFHDTLLLFSLPGF
jgi:hypothetical protein